MPRKFHVKHKKDDGNGTDGGAGTPVAPSYEERRITSEFVTVMLEVGEGQFVTYPAHVFRGDNYEEVSGSIVYLPQEYGYPPPGAVRVKASVTASVFGFIDNYQSGADVEGELPLIAIYEGSAFYEDTGEPVEEMTAFKARAAAEAEADLPSEEVGSG